MKMTSPGALPHRVRTWPHRMWRLEPETYRRYVPPAPERPSSVPLSVMLVAIAGLLLLLTGMLARVQIKAARASAYSHICRR